MAQISQTLSLARIVRPEPGWYRGDFHAHTDQSDGYYPPQQLADVARSEGLDFFTITDHNTVLGHTMFGSQPDLLIIPGVEATFDEGHFNIFGVEDWSDWMTVVCTGNKRVKLAGDFRSFTELLQATAGEGLLNSIAHPLLSPWNWLAKDADLRFITCLEIWNDPSWPDNRDANPQAVALWTDLLNAGHRITAIGGSDYHRPVPKKRRKKSPERLGQPSTFVYAATLSGNGILDGLRQRRAYVSIGPQVTFRAQFDSATYEIGDDLGPVEGAIKFTGQVMAGSRPPVIIARLIKNGRTVTEKELPDVGSKRIEMVDVAEPAEPAWYRLDVFSDDGQYLAITNPIFAGPKRPPELYLYGDFL